MAEIPVIICPACWGSHGCDLESGHDGEHECWAVWYDEDNNEEDRELCSTPEKSIVFCFNCLRSPGQDACDICKGAF